jgi:hypothetical protein
VSSSTSSALSLQRRCTRLKCSPAASRQVADLIAPLDADQLRSLVSVLAVQVDQTHAGGAGNRPGRGVRAGHQRGCTDVRHHPGSGTSGAEVVEQIPEPGYRSPGARTQERAVPVAGERPQLRVAR